MKPLNEATKLILANPDTPDEELLKQLHDAGHTHMTRNKIVQARGRAKARAAGKKVNQVAASGKPRPNSATAYVVDLPSTLTVEEAYQRVVAAGYDVTMDVVYNARRNYKKLLRPNGRGKLREAPPKAEAAPAPFKIAKVKRPDEPQPEHRRVLASAMMRAGLDVARSVLEELEGLYDAVKKP